MYKVVVERNQHSVVRGARYCLTKKSALGMYDLFVNKIGCDFENVSVYKFTRLQGDIFSWAEIDYPD